MNIIIRLIKSIYRRYVQRNANSYIKWMRSKGVCIGDNFKIIANGPLNNITIDMTRPSLISIGNDVVINKNFTLLTHDFVSGIFLNCYNELIPSSGKVVIGNNVRFGMNCTVLKGVKIGDNCFIAAGSIVTSDIPANSIAAGIPAKVICVIDKYFEKRRQKALLEAFEYAQSIYERFNRLPTPEDFNEEFIYFVDSTNIEQFPMIPIRKQLGKSYNSWILNHKAMFSSFEEFLVAAGINTKDKDDR